MSASAWITSILVALVLYGGLGWCIAVAVRKGREEKEAAGGGPVEEQ